MHFTMLRFRGQSLRRVLSISTLVLVVALLSSGCMFYSFTGATIPSHINTVAVPLASDRTDSPLATLDDIMTQAIITQFVNQTRLRLESNEQEADAVLDLTIQQYQNEPTAVGTDQAARNRVSISVAVRYIDRVNEEDILDRTFNASEEYDPIELGTAGEEEAARAALNTIAEDIFTAATSDW